MVISWPLNKQKKLFYFDSKHVTVFLLRGTAAS